MSSLLQGSLASGAVGLSLWWLLCSRHKLRFQAQCCGTQASLLCDLWNLPGSRDQTRVLHYRDRFSTTGPSGKSDTECICILMLKFTHQLKSFISGINLSVKVRLDLVLLFYPFKHLVKLCRKCSSQYSIFSIYLKIYHNPFVQCTFGPTGRIYDDLLMS